MNLVPTVLFSCAGLFVLMLLAAELGRRVGLARLARDSDGLIKGAGSTEAAMFALFGLLIAFTFSGAASRFEARRHMIVDESNAIGTAYLRVDLLPSEAQPPLRELFRTYVDARIEVFRLADDVSAAEAKLAYADELAGKIWQTSVAALEGRNLPPSTATLLLGALNEMIDITDTREMATRNHPPLIVFLLLGLFSLLCSLLVGYTTSPNVARPWLHSLVFAGIVSLTVYVIIDLEYPRLGFIRVDSADDMMLALRASMR